ncbi:DeoR family transcriptional regulator [Enterovibrio norvegicus FF-33]|uniref:DeoR family transcriptional regulator n=1 Tax=Enterovibrio norvegicus FF-454 TaxID=1185651 RepID=A0A1E5CA47_9GAMM|nr:DeoR/GlpR family DNA-binding transcription regulator [Enterovibrio norvegicus]OEE62062.1 DeoR family transcriptional regulator [Enterovibrio norvegicus FF-454]OEE67086.1 DeoR family transcriptional regulator [Enterovibrio norvegicus FF-33]OEE77846.1 DeoR family transcriptional regulator [Enterovibrio norvegicus FF-162]
MTLDSKLKSKTEIRRELIIEMTQAKGNVSVEMLTEFLGVSAQTVRRDINQLCGENLLRRRHGGVESFERQLNAPYQQRALTKSEEKRAIARAVADIIPDGATIFISIGSTPAIVAEALTQKSELTVMTNNLNAAMTLSNEPSNRIIIPGGELRMPDRDILGDGVLDFFNSYRAEFGIFGVAGVTEDGGMLDFHASEVRVREAIRTHCKTSVLVMDSTKLTRTAPAVGGSIFDVDQIIMDRHPGDDFSALSERVGDRLKLVGGEV